MKSHLGSAVLLNFLILAGATTGFADVEVTYIGNNPFSNLGFPNTGRTGMIAGQQPGSATLETTVTSLDDIPIIVDGGPLPAGGMDTINITERIRNNTGVGWTDFHLGVGLIDAIPNLQVEFLNVTNPTGEFSSFMTMPRGLWFFGNVPNGAIPSISFDLKITGQQGASTCSASTSFRRFPNRRRSHSQAAVCLDSATCCVAANRRANSTSHQQLVYSCGAEPSLCNATLTTITTVATDDLVECVRLQVARPVPKPGELSKLRLDLAI